MASFVWIQELVDMCVRLRKVIFDYIRVFPQFNFCGERNRNKKEKSNRRRVGTRAKVEEYDDNDEEGSEMPPRR